MDPVPPTDLFIIACWRIMGAAIGSIVALIYVPPRTKREFFQRLIVSVLTGGTVAPGVAAYMAWPALPEYYTASAAIASCLSWWVVGMVVRRVRENGEKKMDEIEGHEDDKDKNITS